METPTTIPTAARLPAHLEDHDSIREMPVGKSGFTVPWALSSYGPNGCYLRGGYSISSSYGGTVCMRVTHTKTGYEVETPAGYKFREDTGMPVDGMVPVSKVSVSRTLRYF